MKEQVVSWLKNWRSERGEVALTPLKEGAADSDDREVIASNRTNPLEDNNLDQHLYDDLGLSKPEEKKEEEKVTETEQTETVEESVTQDAPSAEGDQQYTEINGVKFSRDDDGNYCLPDGTPVYDSGKVPFRNRVSELTRKMTKLQQEEPRDDIQQTAPAPEREPQPDDDDIDERWNMTHGQKRAILDDINQAVQGVMTPVATQLSQMHVKEKLSEVKEDPKYKKFFSNGNYVAELNDHLSKLSPQAVYQENMITDAIDFVRGKHVDEILAAQEKAVTKKVTSQREIVGEVQVSKPATSDSKSTSAISVEAREYAALSNISPEAAQRTLDKRKARLKKKTKGE